MWHVLPCVVKLTYILPKIRCAGCPSPIAKLRIINGCKQGQWAAYLYRLRPLTSDLCGPQSKELNPSGHVGFNFLCLASHY